MSKRWLCTRYIDRKKVREGREIESPPKIEAFIAEYEALCQKHGIEFGHEDGHGAFEIVPYGNGWASAAHISDKIDEDGSVLE